MQSLTTLKGTIKFLTAFSQTLEAHTIAANRTTETADLGLGSLWYIAIH